MLKRLTNHSEHRVFHQVSEACEEFGAQVYQKIRVADVIDISKCSENYLGTYGLMAHFDFVISNDEHFPLFALEFDGTGHQSKNDWKKNQVCQEAGLALFRINLKALNEQLEKMSFLRYLVHVWFMAHEFERMRNCGQIPIDEPFVMEAFLKPNAEHIFDSEYEFTGPAKRKILQLNKKYNFSKSASADLHTIAHITLSKAMEKFAAIVSYDVGRTTVFGQFRMELEIPSFGSLGETPFGPMAIADFAEGRAYKNLADRLELFLDGAGHTLFSSDEILQQIDQLRSEGFTTLICGGPAGHPFISPLH